MSEYRKLFGSGQEVEVQRATQDGYVWVKARVSSDRGDAVFVTIPPLRGVELVLPDRVRYPVDYSKDELPL